MADELAYILITPYSLLKSRTGGIIGRILARTGLDLIGARVYIPSDDFIEEYCKLIERHDIEPEMKRGLLAYLNDSFRRNNRLGIVNRGFMLLFKGDNAVNRVRSAVGSLSRISAQGDTVRGTYGDFIRYTTGEMKHFEPAVFIGVDPITIRDELRLFARRATSDGGILESAIPFRPDEKPETTLVILKPDNFQLGSARPGNVIDIFSRTGLYIVAAKVLRLSLTQAEEFYYPMLAIFEDRLKDAVAERVKEALGGSFKFTIPPATIDAIADLLKVANARHEFNRIVKYMCGRDSTEVSDAAERNAPGTQKCLALLYRGVDAVRKIRDCLGATNPQEAAPGTVRSVYAKDRMMNTAHASDSVESAERERKIVGLWQDECPSDVECIINNYLANS